MFRSALAVLLLLPALAWAAPDPQASEPTRWRVLVRTPRHPVFTDAFREQLSRELVAALQPGLGLLGSVEVVDTARSAEPAIKAFQEKGWPALDPSPTKPLDGVKLHGLNIDYREGAFTLTARQYDGFTGLSSPLLRTRTVRSLDQIPRAAALLIEPDYGPAATIERSGTDETLVTLTFRGHTLAPLEARVKQGDIFAVAIVKDEKGTLTATPQQFTLLKTIEPVKDGKCQARILSRWANPFGRDYRRAAALRAMKLTTIQAPLKVALVDRSGKPHARGSQLTLTASDLDFKARPTDTDKFEWRDRLYHSVRPFSNVACFSVSIGQGNAQLFPVPILSEDVITLAFDIDAEAQRRAEFLRDCTDLRARIAELGNTQLAMVKSMNTMIDQAQNRDALKRAEGGTENVIAAEKILADQLKHLLEQPGIGDPVAKDVLEACSRQLAVVREDQANLAKTIALLKDAIAKVGTPAALEKEFRVNELVERIKGHLARGDVDEALKAYDLLIAEKPNQASLKDDREKLLAEWTPKDEAHRSARDAIRTLAGAKQPEDFKAACDAVKKAVGVMKEKKDKLGLRKLMNGFEPAIAAFYALLHQADGHAATPENQEALAKLNDMLTDLRQCETLVRNALKDLAEKK